MKLNLYHEFPSKMSSFFKNSQGSPMSASVNRESKCAPPPASAVNSNSEDGSNDSNSDMTEVSTSSGYRGPSMKIPPLLPKQPPPKSRAKPPEMPAPEGSFGMGVPGGIGAAGVPQPTEIPIPTGIPVPKGPPLMRDPPPAHDPGYVLGNSMPASQTGATPHTPNFIPGNPAFNAFTQPPVDHRPSPFRQGPSDNATPFGPPLPNDMPTPLGGPTVFGGPHNPPPPAYTPPNQRSGDRQPQQKSRPKPPSRGKGENRHGPGEG